jgi:hypothetical protein
LIVSLLIELINNEMNEEHKNRLISKTISDDIRTLERFVKLYSRKSSIIRKLSSGNNVDYGQDSDVILHGISLISQTLTKLKSVT